MARSTFLYRNGARGHSLTRAGCADSVWRGACAGRTDSQCALGETLGSQARHRPCERPIATDSAHNARGCGQCGMRLPSVFERGSEGGCVRLRRNGCSKAALSSVPPASGVATRVSFVLEIGLGERSADGGSHVLQVPEGWRRAQHGLRLCGATDLPTTLSGYRLLGLSRLLNRLSGLFALRSDRCDGCWCISPRRS